jgi:hypothetical protein
MQNTILKPGRPCSGFFCLYWTRLLLIVPGLLLLWWTALAIEIAAYSTVPDEGPADAALVLGATEKSLLTRRLVAALTRDYSLTSSTTSAPLVAVQI